MLSAYETYYQASIQITRTEGFWMPHEESILLCSPRFKHLTDAALWLANQREAYDEDNDVFVSLWSAGHLLRTWTI